ncbi:lipopolysaccharide biosynthesis protein [Gemmatimonadota bacterium]
MADEPLVHGGESVAAGSITTRTVSAGQWQVASRGVQAVAQFGVGILLARLLPPEDFGVVALALVFTGFAKLVSNLGLGPAVIQHRNLTPRHIRLAFTLSVLFGLVMAGALFLSAPAIGAVARSDPLPGVLRVLALLFLAAGGEAVARALLRRALDFRHLFVIDITSYFAGYGLVAVSAAFSGLGFWSLVFGALAQAYISTALTLFFARAPMRPLLALAEARELLTFGASVSANGIVNYISRNGDKFLVGRMLGEASLGLYSRAFTLVMLPLNHVSGVLNAVLFPAFSEIQGDRSRIRSGFIMSVQLAALITGPIVAGMLVAAPHMIRGLYGDPWVGAALPLQILCLAAIPRAVPPIAGAVSHACDRVLTELVLQIGFAVLVLVGVILGAPHGLAGVAIFVAVAILCFSVATSWLALSITGGTWGAFGLAQAPGFLVALLTGGVDVALRVVLEKIGAPSLVIFVLLVFASGLSVVLGVYLLPARVRPEDLFGHISSRPEWMPEGIHRGLRGILRVSS